MAIAAVTGLAVNILFVLFAGEWKKLTSTKGHGFFFALIAGVCNTVAMLTFYWAISLGKVSLVVPISCVYPLFTMTAVYLFLRKSERLDVWIVLGTVLIVVGIILII